MPDPQQLSLNLPPHRNHGLFADHYLDHVLPERADWLRLLDDAAPVLAEVNRIFAAYVPSTDEATDGSRTYPPDPRRRWGTRTKCRRACRCRDAFISPITFSTVTTTPKIANKNKVLGKSLPRKADWPLAMRSIGGARSIACCERSGSADGNQNPAFQIYWYMLHSGVEWGILTNGKLWRLVHRESADRLDVYYEVDLQQLVRTGDVSRFLYLLRLLPPRRLRPRPARVGGVAARQHRLRARRGRQPEEPGL